MANKFKKRRGEAVEERNSAGDEQRKRGCDALHPILPRSPSLVARHENG